MRGFKSSRRCALCGEPAAQPVLLITMVSVQPLLVVAVLALFVIDVGSAKPPRFNSPYEEAAAWRKNYKFQYFDNSGKWPKSIASRGMFRFFEVSKTAVRQISQKHGDWCGLALWIEKNTEITTYWKEEERREFRNMLEEGQCVSRERKGFYEDPKKAYKNQKAMPQQITATTFDLALGLAIGFGVLSAILIIAIFILCIMTCLQSSSKAESPPVRPISMPRRSHRSHSNRQNRRHSQRSERSRRSRSSRSQRSVSVRDASTRDESA